MGQLLFAACAVPDAGESLDKDIPGAPREGDRGTMMIRRAGGRLQEARYVVRRGRAMWHGDIDLGPAPRPGQRSLALRDLDQRWPGGVIDWVLGDPFSQADQVTIVEAIHEYEELTPLKFHMGIEPGRPYIAFYSFDDDGMFAGYTTGIGPDGTDDGDETDVNLNIHTAVAKRAVLHELGHTLGLDHEQSRNDRDDTVSFLEACSEDTSQYDTDDPGDFETFESYDLQSIMEYSSAGTCVKASSPSSALSFNNCACYPLVKQGFSHFSDNAGFIFASSDLSPKDIRGLWRMYEPRFGSNEDGDEYGAAVATGDFDGDGFTDLAVGAPGEGRNGAVKAGAVFLYKGTPGGLVAWKVIAESDIAFDPHGGDRFGEMLAVADFNQDGLDDLVVPAPHRNIWGVADGGEVYVLRGTRHGPSIDPGDLQALNQTGYGAGSTEAGDLFGAAVATGDLNGDGFPDLAVGVPGEGHSGGVKSGWVSIFTWHGSLDNALLYDSGLGEPGTPAAGDGFGSALAIANFDNSGRKDLAVGAPAKGSSTKDGAVYLFFSSGTSLDYQQTIHQSASGANASTAGDEFGARLAVGNFDGAKYVSSSREERQLLVGAPGKNSPTDSGRVFVFGPRYNSASQVTGLSQVKYFAQGAAPNASADASDRFGDVLRVVDLDGDGLDDLLAGVPGENLGSLTNAGVFSAFHGTPSGLTGWNTFTELLPVAGGHTAAAVAAADFNRDGAKEIVAGAPGRSASAGVLATWVGLPSSSFLLPLPIGYIDQETHTPE